MTLNYNEASLDELSVLQACLTDGRRNYADLDLPLIEEMLNQVTAEIANRA